MLDGLLPSAPARRKIPIDRQLPPQARNWGRVLDLSAAEPGDLILTRTVGPKPDKASAAITNAQLAGGFVLGHAQWTHAAVYLGDDEHLCEANVKVPGYRYGVIIRSAFDYCDGTYAIRARRPKGLSAKERLRIAIGAAASLGKGYGFLQLYRFWRAARSGRGFWGGSIVIGPRIRTGALVCSTLYQDAYNFALAGNTIRLGSLCTPAHLSASSDFEENEPELSWLEIARETHDDPATYVHGEPVDDPAA
jgi:hypothetical protein